MLQQGMQARAAGLPAAPCPGGVWSYGAAGSLDGRLHAMRGCGWKDGSEHGSGSLRD
jgi:hypothetical protein